MSLLPSQTITEILTLTDTFSQWEAYELETLLEITDEFTFDTSTGLNHQFFLYSLFDYAVNSTRTLSTLLELRSVFSGTIMNVNFINSPVPAINALPQPISAGNILTPQTFTIEYPVGMTALVFDAPQFGDTETFNQIRQKAYTRGNTLIIFRDDAWGDEGIFEYSFTFLSRQQKDLLLLLLTISLGKQIKIIDYLGIERIGYVLSPETEVTQPHKSGWSVSLKFQQDFNP